TSSTRVWIASLPYHLSRSCIVDVTPIGEELAMMAASRLSLVQWRYRGELDHVGSKIRRRCLFTPTAELPGQLSARQLRRQDSARGQGRRLAGRAADQA